MRCVAAWNRRDNRIATLGKDEAIVRQPRLTLRSPHAHAIRRPIDLCRFGVQQRVDAIAALEALGGLEQQAFAIVDLAGDEVRQAAVGEADVWTALDERDLSALVDSTRARCGGRTAGDAADHDEVHRLWFDLGRLRARVWHVVRAEWYRG